MKKKVNLNELAETLLVISNELQAYLCLSTGEVELLSQYDDTYTQEMLDKNEVPDWAIEIAKAQIAIENGSEDYIMLPETYDINQYHIMKSFVEEVSNEKVKNHLTNSIRGSGAFRRFKQGISRYDIEKDWYAFRHEALKKITIEFCEENEIEYEN